MSISEKDKEPEITVIYDEKVNLYVADQYYVDDTPQHLFLKLDLFRITYF